MERAVILQQEFYSVHPTFSIEPSTWMSAVGMNTLALALSLIAAVLVSEITPTLSQCSSEFIGDGWCDRACNMATYDFDGGDCCEHTCGVGRSRTLYPCGITGYDCLTETGIPAWFNQTKICLKWHSEGEEGQCGGESLQHLRRKKVCSPVGSQTPFYLDSTDNRTGGCRMQWAVVSPRSQYWFRESRLCYRWTTNGDGAQCNQGAREPYIRCAPVGAYTPAYTDDTDERPGGCQLSWAFFIPSDSPEWLREAKLCFHWDTDGNSTQCGGPGVARDLCASVNQWTRYFLDDTDDRPGGCYMSWSLQLY